MRLLLKRRATRAGTCVFMAQVNDSRPVEPNLRPAMKTTFEASGSCSISRSFSKSQRSVSTPASSRAAEWMARKTARHR